MTDIRQTSLPTQNADPINDNPTRAVGFSTKNYGVPHADNSPLKQVPRIVTSPPMDFYTTAMPIAASVINVRGSNDLRKYLMLQNIGTQNIWLAFGNQPVVNDSQLLPPNGVWLFESVSCPNNELNAISVGVGSKLAFTEGVIRTPI